MNKEKYHFRPKRNKLRPGNPPAHFVSTTTRPKIYPKAQANYKSQELDAVKQAWLNYLAIAKAYSKKYRERVDVRKFKQVSTAFEIRIGEPGAGEGPPNAYVCLQDWEGVKNRQNLAHVVY